MNIMPENFGADMKLQTTVFSLLLLASCGLVYHPSKVTEGTNDSGLKVQIIKVNAENVQLANRTPYKPRSVPKQILETGEAHSEASGGSKILPDPPLWNTGQPGTDHLALPPKPVPARYRIGRSDKVRLLVVDDTKKSEGWNNTIEKVMDTQSYKVEDDGSISIPTLGRIQIQGKTVEEAETAVGEKLIKSGKNVSVAVEVSEFNSQEITIGGDVKSPGRILLNLNTLHLSEAIARSGGIQNEARKSGSITLFRNGQQYSIPMSAFEKNAEVQNLVLVNGDKILVSPDFDIEQARKNFEHRMRVIETEGRLQSFEAEASQLQASEEQAVREEKRNVYKYLMQIGAIERDYAYLIGDVENQIKYTLPFNRHASLAEALYDKDNGINVRTGNPKQVYVLRRDKTSRDEITAWNLDGSNAANLVLSTDFQLRPNDMIFVAAQPITNWHRVLTQIQPSLVDTSVNQILSN